MKKIFYSFNNNGFIGVSLHNKKNHLQFKCTWNNTYGDGSFTGDSVVWTYGHAELQNDAISTTSITILGLIC